MRVLFNTVSDNQRMQTWGLNLHLYGMDTKEKYKQPTMTNWYDPRQLSATALKALVSGTFASYADKRELQAALDPGKTPIDCSTDAESKQNLEEIWIDFVSDTGDGFNSTYTVADLVAQSLKVNLNPGYAGGNKSESNSWDLPAGQLLLFGGDQVYPTPSMAAYENRFKIPFSAASKKHHPQDTIHRKMFAIPGNHDWYDGLGNFLKLFCQERRIGNWQTAQQRSYYALKLPNNFWLWATDVQLNSDIDQPQKDYFREIASKHMQEGDKVILVTAEPAWVYKVIHRNNTSYKRLKFFEQVFITGDKYDLTGKKFRLVATLTGDLHHYSRYEEHKKTSEGVEYINQLVTAGGGGAFLHPTHNLPQILSGLDELDDAVLDNTQIKDPEMKACFPTVKESRKIADKMLLFPFYNIAFWATMTVIQLLLAWMLQSATQYSAVNFMHELAVATSIGRLFQVVSNHLFLNPPVLIICLIVITGMYIFADGNSGKRNYKWVGAVHGLVQLFSMFLFIWLFSWVNISTLGIKNNLVFFIVYVAETFLLGGLTGSYIMGLYLWFSSLYLDIHIDESFSALGIPDYKNFLRIHISPEGTVTIYPIGIEKVVTNWKQQGSGENITFSSPDTPKYYLIEPPVIITEI